MGFLEVKSTHFRNLQQGRIDFRNRKNIFLVGPNGQGKTNILELLYFLCYGSSFRTKNDQSVILHGKKDLYCSSRIEMDGSISQQVEIRIENREKKIHLNSKRVQDRKELLSLLPCIVFCHDDISFVNGTPEKKRWFFDQTLTFRNGLYIDDLRNYKSVLKQRNIVLKRKKKDLLEIYSVQLARIGLSIQKEREALILKLEPVLKDLFGSISEKSGKLSLQYQPSWKDCHSEKEAFDTLMSKADLELEKGVTFSGPHRDNYLFTLDGVNFQDCGSTGQMRLVSLLLRVVQSIYLTENRHVRPIYLLDDVLLELDRKKRNDFLKFLPDYEQAFFTFLPGNDTYKDWKDFLFLDILEGAVHERSE